MQQPWRVIRAGAAGAAGVLLLPVVAPVALGVLGFGVLGPIAGTLAAALQASIGNVAAGSVFALAQGIAMGGAVPLAAQAIAGAAGVAAVL